MPALLQDMCTFDRRIDCLDYRFGFSQICLRLIAASCIEMQTLPIDGTTEAGRETARAMAEALN
ncbi:hypothetical protein ACC734_39355, partial [Rhizobium ruizarguesonis]